MSTTQPSTADDSIELTDGDTVENFGRFHARLADRLNDLQARVPDNYDMTVEYSPYMDGDDRVVVTIDSDEFVLNEGEVGDRHFHVILRERGGLSLATRRTTILGSERDYLDRYDTKSGAWDGLLRDVKRAN
jgi:hypothetical protein